MTSEPPRPFRKVVDDRLSADLDARAALYDSGTPQSQPGIGASACLSCHQR